MAMIARGAFGNPWIFERANAVIEGRPVPPLPPLADRVDTAVAQVEAAAAQKGERLACLEARKQLAWYLHGVPRSAQYRSAAVTVETLADVYSLAAVIKKELR